MCPKCLSNDTYEEPKMAKNGVVHLGLYCSACGTWIKWKPQGGPVKMWYGKHKGKEFKDIPKDYLLWAVENLKDEKTVAKIKEYLDGAK